MLSPIGAGKRIWWRIDLTALRIPLGRPSFTSKKSSTTPPRTPQAVLCVSYRSYTFVVMPGLFLPDCRADSFYVLPTRLLSPLLAPAESEGSPSSNTSSRHATRSGMAQHHAHITCRCMHMFPILFGDRDSTNSSTLVPWSKATLVTVVLLSSRLVVIIICFRALRPPSYRLRTPDSNIFLLS